MSIAVLNQVYDEMRRLAIAGSVVVGGDFRLKKLVAPLEQAGAKAPVFAKVALAVKSLVESNDQTSAWALLDLCVLVNAVMYTQGETGIAGELKPIATIDLGPPTTQASARILKPLLDALTATGAGRLEIIRDAHLRGAFRDMRLVKPALQSLDDAYPDIAEFVADNVLPLYGVAILPGLMATFDVKGKAGHVRRLGLMHRLDPVGTRAVVKEALENGSKEIRVAAIGCLGDQPEDLAFLLEQATAKALEVRRAALHSLAQLDADEAMDALKRGLVGDDLELAVHAVRESRNANLLRFAIIESEAELDNVCKSRDPKTVARSADRLEKLLLCFFGRHDEETEAFLLRCFGRREELLAAKGEDVGSALNQRIAARMGDATPRTRQALVAAHASLGSHELAVAFYAACRMLTPPEVFEMFSLYVTAKAIEKKKQADPSAAKRDAIVDAIVNVSRWPRGKDAANEEKSIVWDPRWLDVAVGLKHFPLVDALARPGHSGANALLAEAFAANLKKSKDIHGCAVPLATMVRVGHPEATDAIVAVLTKFATAKAKYGWGVYWIGKLIPDLPASAAPVLEALLPTLHEKAIDELVEHVAALKNKA